MLFLNFDCQNDVDDAASGKIAAAMAEELGIRKGNQNLHFAQLMGMADGLSQGLRNAGFQVSKYLPFGPVDQIIPYLLRRAEENKGFLSSSALDRGLLRYVGLGTNLFSLIYVVITSNSGSNSDTYVF